MKYLKLITGTLAGLLLTFNASAQSIRDHVLDDVYVKEKDGCVTIQVAFTFPVSYVNHFPFDKGDELRIQFEPIGLGPAEREELFDRETLKPHRHKLKTPFIQVTYEGDIDEGFSLTLLFSEPVSYEVGQGPDFRSILISLQNQTPMPDGTSCPHLPKIKK